MYKSLKDSGLYWGVENMPKNLRGSDEKGNYEIHKVAHNRVEVQVESKKMNFSYRVHILFKPNFAAIKPATRCYDGVIFPLNPDVSETVLDSTLYYAFTAVAKEAKKHQTVI